MVPMQRNVFLVLLFASCCAARRGFRSSAALENEGTGKDTSVVTSEKIMLESSAEQMISAMVGQFLEEGGPGVNAIIKAASGKVDIKEAVRKLEGQLPADVAWLVRSSTTASSSSSSSSSSSTLNETSIQRARNIMNHMMETSIGEIDDIIFECKEFQERNRGAYEQVVNDVARLGSQLARLETERVTSNQCMSDQDAATRRLEESLEVLTTQFNALQTTNSIELTRRRNDLGVFEIIMNATACPAGLQLSLLQGKPSPPASGFSVCSSDDGMTLNLHNEKLQAEVEKMMTPSARLALRSALGQVTPTLLELQGGRANTSTSIIARASQVVSEVPNAANWRKCTDLPPTPGACGKVHDTMSIEWGRFRDEVDELATEMTRNQQEYDTQRNNLNEQISAATDGKSQCQEEYAASTSSINADTEEQNEKLEQKRQLTTEYTENCDRFRLQITTKIHEEVCMIVTVRNALLTHSTTTTPDNTIDCQVTDWTPKTGTCVNPEGTVILCDDTCPRSDPNLCGGTMTMKRDILVTPSASGVQCGVLERPKRCGQKKCPVDCSMSTWSGWSRCSRDCEGGVQLKTRSVIVRPMNGGRGCEAVQEERACNTGSCDRNCVLEDWTDWQPCSQACTTTESTGWTGRTRAVLIPIRGQGRCPRETARRRWNSKTCNTQRCAGDEICIAQQDLVIALDASGSLRQAGFQALRNFTVNLTMRYEAKYFGQDSVKMGAVLFGNGNITRGADGTWSISDAIKLHDLSFDIPAVRSSIAATTWQYGFTNMAQALSAGDFLLSRAGRDGAQSAILVLSDGRPSFAVQTAQKAQELKDKNIKIFMAPVMEFPTPQTQHLKDWSSHPWQTNFQQIPGIPALSNNAETFVQELIVKFCPDAVSPTILSQQETNTQYMMIHENGKPNAACGASLSQGVVTPRDECAQRARTQGWKAFAYGRDDAVGSCYIYEVTIVPTYWQTYSANRTNPPCPGGGWEFNPYFDTYAIDPAR